MGIKFIHNDNTITKNENHYLPSFSSSHRPLFFIIRSCSSISVRESSFLFRGLSAPLSFTSHAGGALPNTGDEIACSASLKSRLRFAPVSLPFSSTRFRLRFSLPEEEDGAADLAVAVFSPASVAATRTRFLPRLSSFSSLLQAGRSRHFRDRLLFVSFGDVCSGAMASFACSFTFLTPLANFAEPGAGAFLRLLRNGSPTLVLLLLVMFLSCRGSSGRETDWSREDEDRSRGEVADVGLRTVAAMAFFDASLEVVGLGVGCGGSGAGDGVG